LPCRKYLGKAKGRREFDVVWSSADPPDSQDTSDTCTVQLPLHLRREDPEGTVSIGHLLRDNLFHLVTIPPRFGLLADSFAWVTWPRSEGKKAHATLKILTKTSPLLSAHTSRRWHELERSCQRSRNELGPGAACSLR